MVAEAREEVIGGSPDKADDSSDESSPRTALDITVSGSTDSDSSSGGGGGAATAEESHTHQWRAFIRGLLQRKKPIRRLSTFPPAANPETTRWRPLRKLERTRTAKESGGGELPLPLAPPPPLQLPPLIRWRPMWRSFELKELATATDDFSSGKP